MALYRKKDAVILTLTDNAVRSDGGGNSGTAGILDLNEYAYGSIGIPTGWVAARLTFETCNEIDGTYTPLYDVDGALVDIASISTSAAQRYELPAQVFMCRYVKVVSTNTATTATVSQTGGPLSLPVLLGT